MSMVTSMVNRNPLLPNAGGVEETMLALKTVDKKCKKASDLYPLRGNWKPEFNRNFVFLARHHTMKIRTPFNGKSEMGNQKSLDSQDNPILAQNGSIRIIFQFTYEFPFLHV